MKQCFKCKEVLPLEQFYRHPQMADGHLNKCKSCTKKDVKRNRDKKIDYYQEYDRYRFQNDPRVKQRHKRYAKTPEGKSALYRATKSYRSKYPEKYAAHRKLNKAVANGAIIKPDVCGRCKKETESIYLHGHHHDYSRPLDVEWICVWCHVEEHKRES